MKPVLKWLAVGLGGLAGVLVLAVAGAYGASEMVIRHGPAKPAIYVPHASDPLAAERGRHVATRYGCFDCHGRELTGKLFYDEMPIARIAAPNLTRAVATQSDEDLVRAIKAGVAADGRPLWIMPSEAFSRLSDAETADLLAYLRTLKPHGGAQPVKQIGPVGRIGVLLGKFRSAPAQLQTLHALAPADLGAEHAQGRALTRVCMECHGLDLKGSATTGAPDLTIAGAYDLSDFERLLRTGVAAGNRRLGLMSDSAPGRFNDFSHDEIAALHAYLRARAESATN